MLFWFGFGERHGLAADELLSRVVGFVPMQCDLSQQEERLDFAPRIAEPRVESPSCSGVCFRNGVLSTVQSVHCNQSFATCFAAWIFDESKGFEGRACSLMGAYEVAIPVVGVGKGQVTLGHAESVANALQIVACNTQHLARYFG